MKVYEFVDHGIRGPPPAGSLWIRFPTEQKKGRRGERRPERKGNSMSLVASNLPECQPPPSGGWTPAARARAKARVDGFVLELRTNPAVPTVPVAMLRLLYPLHYYPRFVVDVLHLVVRHHWDALTVRRVVKAFLQAPFARCRGQYGECPVHVVIEHTTNESTITTIATDTITAQRHNTNSHEVL